MHVESAGTSGGGNRREVLDLFSWIQCFGMYAAVVMSKQGFIWAKTFGEETGYQGTLMGRIGGPRGWMQEGDVPPPVRSAKAEA